MSRLIVLSNRVKLPENNPMAGGLAVALNDVLLENCGIWIGWNGQIEETPLYNNKSSETNNFNIQKQSSLSAYSTVSKQEVTYITTALTPNQYKHYYCGFANNVLWSLLHEQPDLILQAPDDYAVYQSVNQLFAKQLNKIIQPNDVIWVHDYHFLSVAYYCRQLGIKNRIGFFLHIPFAPLNFWQQLDKSGELINHLAHYDVVGTQTQQDKANCLNVFQHYLKEYIPTNSFSNNRLATYSNTKHIFEQSDNLSRVQVNLNLDQYGSHRLAIDAYPIGVNVAKIQQQVSDLAIESAATAHNKLAIKSAAQNIIAVDRIDYSKGLLERFSAYSLFLQQYPHYQNQLNFFQIACPSRLDLTVYQRLYDTVRQTVSQVNQQFLGNEYEIGNRNIVGSNTDFLDTDFLNIKGLNIKGLNTEGLAAKGLDTATCKKQWQAISYCESVLSHETLMKAFWHSDIGWVNSLKDGMNLVAKEYIAAQNPDNPGVLLLSRYAGASEQMQAAVIIDPHRPESIIKGLKTALQMPLAERKIRHQELLMGLQQHNLQAWQQGFLEDLYDVI